jgi:digeranylgeranylglycerophospholipid reductase
MRESPDIVVVGLGPAGSCAARAAAAMGARVVALERRPAPGRPVQCAELVPALLEQDVSGLAHVTAQPVARMLTTVEGGPFDETAPFPGRMIDRAAFDAMLAAAAAEAGAACRHGVAVLSIARDGTLETTAGIVRPRIVIGADGPRSSVGRAVDQVNRVLVETRQVAVPLLAPHDATDIFLSADYPGGYGWLFPKGDSANLGIGAAPEARRWLKPLLEALHRVLWQQGRVGSDATALTGGAIPVGGRLRCIGALDGKPVLLAGDAAGLANPITGAGIAAAVQSGRLAGEAAAAWLAGRGSALDDYEAELAELYDGALARALARRAALLDTYRGGGRPDAAALRAGWIAYPQYWAA